MTRANPHRGEVEISVGGGVVVLRPTFAALAQVEIQTDAAIFKLLQRAMTLDLTLKETQAIVAACATEDAPLILTG